MASNLPATTDAEIETNQREADSVEEAVFINQLPSGETMIVGNESREEWISTSDMGPLRLDDCL
jgi:hypothetical protein